MCQKWRIWLYSCKLCGGVCVFMQGSEVRVNFVVMRATEAQEEGGRGIRRPEPQYFRRRSAYMKVGPNVTGTVPALVCFYLTHMFLFAQCDCNGCSFVNHTRSRHTQWQDPPLLQVLVRADTCVIVRRWKSLPGPSCPDQKAWGAAHSATTGPLFCCFWLFLCMAEDQSW